MSSAVAELEAGLQAMLSLKPPGVSGSRISSLTALCAANIQSESVLVQKLYTQFKKAPATHKLGVLYVVDSVTRKWRDHAKTRNQTVNSSAEDGTYAAGIYKVTELLPALMNDIIQNVPIDQKDKVKKLVQIWEASQTFPSAMLAKFKAQLNASSSQKSTTPDGTPPRSLEAALGIAARGSVPAPPPAPAADTSSILQALAKMAKQSTTIAASAQGIAAQVDPHRNSVSQRNPPQDAGVNPQYPVSSVQAVNGFLPTTSSYAGQSNGAQIPHNMPPMPQYGTLPAPLPPTSGVATIDPALEHQIRLLKTLADNGIPQEQWAGIISALAATANGTAAPPASFPIANQAQSAPGWTAPIQEDFRDRSYQDTKRSSNENYLRRRSRSVSPQRAWNSRDSTQSRHNGGYDDYDRGRNSPRHGRSGDQGQGRGNEYRQRSPPRRGRSPSPPKLGSRGAPIEKFVDFDAALPEDHIKVLSRTLFCGGVTSTEQDLRQQFSNFGSVQSVIVNREKRHAFVKMTNRQDAAAARTGMDSDRGNEGGKSRTTRWGVGFGPRDCCDYTTGTSIIPISKLTDADRKWMLTAEYGGTGGRPIQGGMVVEEPDIEIGQGVSSKAISRRNQQQTGSHDFGNSPPSRFRKPEKKFWEENQKEQGGGNGNYDSGRGASESFGGLPQVPGFPMGFPMMPMIPPNFQFPGMSEPGPPGRH